MAKAGLIIGYFWVAVLGMAVLLVVVQLLLRGLVQRKLTP